MAESKRLFLAVPIGPAEDGPLASLRAALKRTRIGAKEREMDIKWVPEAGFHVTLSFLGETDLARIDELKSLVAEVAASAPPFETTLRGMGGFPDLHHMRVLWIGVRKCRALGELQARLEEALLAKEFLRNPEQDYVPHLTIGRLRKQRSGSDLVSPYNRTTFGEIAIDSIVLFESVMHGANPVYLPLARFALQGSLPDSYPDGEEQ